MKSKPVVGVLVLLFIAIFVWSLNTAVGTIVLGRDDFIDWRADNTTLYYGIWLAEVVVLGLPALWFVGKRMGAFAAQQDQAAVAARGVGRLAGQALRGDQKSIGHLLKLLDDGSPAVRYQSARALAMLDDTAANKELVRKVRYWDVEHKLGLIDVLKRTMDLRTVRLLRELGTDRNPMVARKAKTALTIVSSRSGSIDDIVAKRRKQAKAKQAKEAQKKAKAGEGAGFVTAAPDAEAPAITSEPPTAGATPSTGARPKTDAPPAAAPKDDTPSD